MTYRELSKGDACPPLTPGLLRIYSWRFCPYAQRARLVLAHKQIKHEVVDINLFSKPEWFVTKNPLQELPALELDDKIVYESAVCMDYLEDMYPEPRLSPTDPYVKARHRMLMLNHPKLTEAYYKIAYSMMNAEKIQEGLTDLPKALVIFEDALKEKFFGGDQPCMLDYFLYPWFEREPMLVAITKKPQVLLYKDKTPKLCEWFKIMQTLPAVKESVLTPEQHVEMFHKFMSIRG